MRAVSTSLARVLRSTKQAKGDEPVHYGIRRAARQLGALQPLARGRQRWFQQACSHMYCRRQTPDTPTHCARTVSACTLHPQPPFYNPGNTLHALRRRTTCPGAMALARTASSSASGMDAPYTLDPLWNPTRTLCQAHHVALLNGVGAHGLVERQWYGRGAGVSMQSGTPTLCLRTVLHPRSSLS